MMFNVVIADSLPEPYIRHMKNRPEQGLMLHFAIDIPQPADPKKHNHIHSAKLKLFKSQVFPENLRPGDIIAMDSGVRVNVYQLLEDPLYARSGEPYKRLVDSKIVSLRETGWEEFRLQESVQQWLDNPRTNFGLEISCDSYNIGDVVQFVHHEPSATPADASADLSNTAATAESSQVVIRGNVEEEIEAEEMETNAEERISEFMPVLNVYSQERLILGRQKRAEETYGKCVDDEEDRCCRYSLWVSFKDIGWDDWIVAPDGYEAFYCKGECPHRYKMAHAFAGVQALMNRKNPDSVPGPCCSATKLSPLSLLHYNEKGDLVVSVYEDMIVQECKCS